MGREEPLRKCVSCNEMKNKSDLIRIAKDKEGQIRIDERGRAPGRGAYLCRNRSCIENAFKKKRLEAALKTAIGADIKEAIMTQTGICDSDGTR
ncbi:MAG: YlxR family protein [Lachnospiraceae bacterium]|nr:YlxR family protein [Lachnospiraceae bacterium]